ncbi:MAG TPA: hypothetical protein VFM38_13980 [Candidatus Limnocylindrales bacterium]|nr:hypothetical protein [Candidatus Limnocylindrales bacterium]
MGFLRRLLGGDAGAAENATPVADPAQATQHAVTADEEERARELEVLREDQARLDDLARRQLRYAEYAWQPPAQGGERRADDTDSGETG